MLPVTGFYAAILGLGFVWLSVRVIGARRSHRVAIGTGGHRLMERAIRAHGNFAEYVPLALVLLALLEANGGPTWMLHLLGVALLTGRVLHALGITQEPEVLRFRVAGMGITLTVIGLGALASLGLALARP